MIPLQFTLPLDIPLASHGTIKAGIEIVTPAMCEELVATANTGDMGAAPMKRKVAVLEDALRSRALHLNGDVIIISDKGVLLGGRARCRAGANTGIPFASVVVRGVPSELIYKMDLRTQRRKPEEVPHVILPGLVEVGADGIEGLMRRRIQQARLVIEFEELTVEKAQFLIGTVGPGYGGKRNRKHLRQITADVANRQFPVTGESIKVGASGRLLDGLKRCQAVAATGKSIWVLMVYNVDDRLAETYDAGRRSSYGHRWAAKKAAKPYDLASSFYLIHMIERNDETAVPRSSQLRDIHNRHPQADYSVQDTHPCEGFIAQSVLAPLHTLFAEANGPAAKDFLKRLLQADKAHRGEGPPLPEGDPVRRLREELEGARTKRLSYAERARQARLVIRAWNGFRGAKTPRSKAAGFPRISG